MVKQQHKQFKRKKSVIWGLVIFEVIGWIVLAGMLLHLSFQQNHISHPGR